MKPCSVCGLVGCRVVAHSFATNAASNGAASATNDATTAKSATNASVREVVVSAVRPQLGDDAHERMVSTYAGEVLGLRGEKASSADTGVVRNGGVEERTQNRRARESYNAYQREYMKVYRAVKAGRAEWVR